MARKIASQQKIIFLGYPTGQIQIEITWAQCLEPRAVSKVHQYSKAVPNMGYTNCQWHFFWWSPWETPIKTKGQHSQTNAIQAYKMSIYLCNIYIYTHNIYIYVVVVVVAVVHIYYIYYMFYTIYHWQFAVFFSPTSRWRPFQKVHMLCFKGSSQQFYDLPLGPREPAGTGIGEILGESAAEC